MKIKGPGKIALIVIASIIAFFGARWFLNRPKDVGKSAEVGKVIIPDAPESSLVGTGAIKLPFPSTNTTGTGLKIVWNQMAWNSQTSINYANGGVNTTKNSLIEKAGLNIQIVRQDNCVQSCTDMVKYIKDYKDGKTKDGFFITFMGSGVPAYLYGMNEAVKDLGPEYAPIAFLTTGKSYGEDQVIGEERFKSNPQSLRGAVCHGVRMDGDIDLILKYAGDNGVPVNGNDKLYYPDALNLSYSSDYLVAVNEYNQNLKQTRKMVVDGVTGKDTTVGIDLIATWTPGDVNAFNGRGGVTIISTKKYASMMPNITITCKKFLNDNRSSMENLVVALAQAGDQVRSFDDVKRFATKLNAQIWNEKDGDYWYKYYNGVTNNEDKRVPVGSQLGGSMVYNLSDMSKMLGLSGSADIYKEVYNTFGKLQSSLYPKDLPFLVEYSKAFDKSIIGSVVSNHPELLEGKALEVDYSNDITTKVSSKDVNINFETGSATISSSSYALLNEIYSSAVTSEGLKLGIYGYTDNVGDPTANHELSLRRAESVKNYLTKKGLSSNRVEVKGFGEENPVANNNTKAGQARNRRVQLVLGN